MKTDTPPDPWPQDRRQELSDLQDLLRDIATINNGSSFIQKLEQCIATAKRLTETDWRAKDRREAFIGWLIDKAITESRPHPAGPVCQHECEGGTPRCLAEAPTGHQCTRNKGHTGDHSACGHRDTDHDLRTWPQ
jgi:hypothetical protein